MRATPLPSYPYEDAVCACCEQDFSRPHKHWGSDTKSCFLCRMNCRNATSCRLGIEQKEQVLADWKRQKEEEQG